VTNKQTSAMQWKKGNGDEVREVMVGMSTTWHKASWTYLNTRGAGG